MRLVLPLCPSVPKFKLQPQVVLQWILFSLLALLYLNKFSCVVE
jgi:hypothetical protein